MPMADPLGLNLIGKDIGAPEIGDFRQGSFKIFGGVEIFRRSVVCGREVIAIEGAATEHTPGFDSVS